MFINVELVGCLPCLAMLLEASTKLGLNFVHLLQETLLNRDIDGIEGEGSRRHGLDINSLGDAPAVAVVVASSESSEKRGARSGLGRQSDGQLLVLVAL